MIEKVIFWGTGKIAEQYEKVINDTMIQIVAYIDNNPEKWGNVRNNVPIICPEEMTAYTNVPILIACIDEESVSNQIKEISDEHPIVSYDALLHQIFIGNSISIQKNTTNNREIHRVIIDNLWGRWGGAEDWCHKVGDELSKRLWDVKIVESNSCDVTAIDNQIILKLDLDENIFVRHKQLVELLEEMRPFVYVDVWGADMLWAASLVKIKHPNDVVIISSILNDVPKIYNARKEWGKYIDAFLAISSRIANNLINNCIIPKEKIFRKEPFVEGYFKKERTYSIENECQLQICFPCRLVKKQKRADLIPEILMGLSEKIGNNFVFNIVGNGEYESCIQEFVLKNKLQHLVRFWGKIDKSALVDMFYEQDIYLNISDYEGTSLTMLEALGAGCVPVVTNVSGVEDFIVDRENGLISEIGNTNQIVDNLVYLEQNRKLLPKYGQKSSAIIESKCQIDKYIDYFEGMIWQVL